MCAAKARDLRKEYDRQAKERMRQGGERGGKASGACRRAETKPPVNLPEASGGDARDEIARAFGISGKSVDYAIKLAAQMRL
jgi:hypothetical protein